MPLHAMKHDDDPRAVTLTAVGDVSELELFHNYVLVATYMRPEKTKGGIILTDRQKDEDKWQGKVGLVIKKGPAAFRDDEKFKFYGKDVERGDWIFYRSSDGFQMTINGHHCRMLEDTHVRGRAPAPDVIF